MIQVRCPVGGAGLHSGDQFAHCERFDEIVIRACVETTYTIFDRVPGGQNEDRNAAAHGVPSGEERQSVPVGEPKVEDRCIVVN